MRYDRVPNAVYGSPEIATIGLTEKEVKDKGFSYKVRHFLFKLVVKHLPIMKKDGFIKLIVNDQYKEILGAHILAYNASDLIAERIELEGTAYELAHTIHPTSDII